MKKMKLEQTQGENLAYIDFVSLEGKVVRTLN